MKYLIGFSLLLSFSICSCKKESKSLPKVDLPPKVRWLNFQDVLDNTKQNKKKIFVFVYADWCPKCKRLESETFKNQKLINEMNENYRSVKFNAHCRDEIMYKGKKYSNPTYDTSKEVGELNEYHEILFEITAKSIPSMVILDENLEIIGSEMGFKESGELRSLLNMYKNY